MPPVDHHSQPLFGPTVVRATLVGAVLGLLGVVAMFTAGVLMSGLDPAAIGAAGLAGPFGGAGFGAMIGAVLASIKAHEAEQAEERAARPRPSEPTG